jgi:hypothetical protein
MAEKSITNAKTPRQVAKTARKVSGSTRKDRKAALKSVARTAAKTKIGEMLTDKATKNKMNESWTGENPKADGMKKATTNAIKANYAATDKARTLGVKPKKIAKVGARAEKAVAKRVSKAAKR